MNMFPKFCENPPITVEVIPFTNRHTDSTTSPSLSAVILFPPPLSAVGTAPPPTVTAATRKS